MEVLTEVDRDRIESLLRARRVLLARPERSRPTPTSATVGELLGLHELALEDTREFGQRPKLDRYPDAVLLVYWTAHVAPDGRGVELVEVHLHISGGFLFTVRRADCPELDELRDALRPEDPQAEDYVVYRVLDGLTDALYPVVDHLEARIDALEEQVLRDTDRRQLGEIYRLKQEVQAVQRRIVPQRDQFGAAIDGDPRAPRPHARQRTSTCATSATTSRRWRASSTARPTTSPR